MTKREVVLIYGSRRYAICLSLFFMLNFASSTFMLLYSMRHMKKKKIIFRSANQLHASFEKYIADLLAYKQCTGLHIQPPLHMLPDKPHRNSLLPPYGKQYQNMWLVINLHLKSINQSINLHQNLFFHL